MSSRSPKIDIENRLTILISLLGSRSLRVGVKMIPVAPVTAMHLTDADDADEVDDEGGSAEESALRIPGNDGIEYGDAMTRVAIQNCDWENIGAIDLLAILQSYCPTGRVVKLLTIGLW